MLGGTAWLLHPLGGTEQIPAPQLPSYTPEPPDLQETVVLGPTTFAPGTQGATRVLVRDPRSGEPIPGTDLRLSLAPRGDPDAGQTLYVGRSDEWGTAEVTFHLPEDTTGAFDLVLDADGPIGTQRVVRPVTLAQEAELVVSTDKQVYYPGETIRFWSLARRSVDGLPVVDAPVTFTLLNVHSSRVCTRTATTSSYGVAHASYDLADRVAPGPYRLLVNLDSAAAEHEFVVGPPIGPGLVVQFQAERPYYLSGERLTAVVRASDLLGQAVTGATVDVRGTVDETDEIVFQARGQTDEQGSFALAVGLDPSTLGRAENGPALVRVTARAMDKAGRVGQHEVWVPVSAQPMWIAAWPESGTLKPGIENLVHLQVLSPDGQPVRCDLALSLEGVEGGIEVSTNAAGRAQVGYMPAGRDPVTMTVVARDATGQAARTSLTLAVESGEHHLLLRPEGERYSTGELLRGQVFAPGVTGAVYLDLRRNGQGVATHAAPVVEGYASFEVALPGDLSGVFELHAYVLEADGTVVRDARQVVVAPLRPVNLSVLPTQARYKVGDNARVLFRVVEEGGQSVQGTFGAIVAVVESISLVDAVCPRVASDQRDVLPAGDLSPQYAETVSLQRPMPESVRREFHAYETAWAERHRILSAHAARLLWGVVGWAALCWVVVLIDGWQSRTERAFGRALGTLLGGAIALPLVVGGGVLLAFAGSALLGVGAVLALGMAWIGALLALAAQGWTRRNGWLRLCAALALSAVALGGGLRFLLVRGAVLALPLIVVGLGALGAALLSMCVAAVGRLRKGDGSGSLALLSVAVLLVCTAAAAVLAGVDESIPVYARLPEPAQTTNVPAPRFVQPDAPLMVVPQETEVPPLVAQQWSGRTLYWDPEARTDAHGNLALDLPLGESPANLRLWALILTEEGTGAAATAQVTSYAPLSVALALPERLTVGDRLDVPVHIRNGLPISQTVQISVVQASWYRLRTWGVEVQRAEVPANGVTELVLPIQVCEWGDVALDLAFRGDAHHGVVSRAVDVRPNGHLVARAYSWWIGDWTSYKFRVPWSAVRGTDQIAVGLYPGHWSVLAQALARAVQWEGGSFDQVSAAMQARLLQAAYLRRIDGWEGARRAELERQLALDYQRLLAFESPEGGFSAFGAGPADLYRSALALRCLVELSAYHPVDTAMLDRTALWLFRQQTEGGTWRLSEVPPSWYVLPRDELPTTAYVAWALVDAGYGHLGDIRSAIEHLEQNVDQSGDPYVLALVVNALVAHGKETEALDAALARLAEQAVLEEGLALWPSRLQTLSGATGGHLQSDGYKTPSVKVESVALATFALSRARVYPERVSQGLAMLTDSRDVHGTWNAPQATVLALRAYLSALPEGQVPSDVPFEATVAVTVDEVSADPAVLRGDVGRILLFDELAKGYNDVEIAVDGQEIAYQIVGRYVLPWSQVPPPSPEEEDVSVEVSYDRTSLLAGEWLTVTVGVALNRPGVAPLVELDLGLPPGFDLDVGSLGDLRTEGAVAHYERAGGRLVVCLTDLSSEEPARFHYRLRAGFPMSVLTGPTYAIDVANPQRPAVRPPVEIEVVSR
jgi:hypothetical protein